MTQAFHLVWAAAVAASMPGLVLLVSRQGRQRSDRATLRARLGQALPRCHVCDTSVMPGRRVALAGARQRDPA